MQNKTRKSRSPSLVDNKGREKDKNGDDDERPSHVLRHLEPSEISVGLYGRTMVTFTVWEGREKASTSALLPPIDSQSGMKLRFIPNKSLRTRKLSVHLYSIEPFKKSLDTSESMNTRKIFHS
jgi:hypothetical protein